MSIATYHYRVASTAIRGAARRNIIAGEYIELDVCATDSISSWHITVIELRTAVGGISPSQATLSQREVQTWVHVRSVAATAAFVLETVGFLPSCGSRTSCPSWLKAVEWCTLQYCQYLSTASLFLFPFVHDLSPSPASVNPIYLFGDLSRLRLTMRICSSEICDILRRTEVHIMTLIYGLYSGEVDAAVHYLTQSPIRNFKWK